MSGYQEGDVLTLKKNHPCGSKEWTVLRTGWEYRLQCAGCKHIVLMKRDQLEKLVRRVQPGYLDTGTDVQQNAD